MFSPQIYLGVILSQVRRATSRHPERKKLVLPVPSQIGSCRNLVRGHPERSPPQADGAEESIKNRHCKACEAGCGNLLNFALYTLTFTFLTPAPPPAPPRFPYS